MRNFLICFCTLFLTIACKTNHEIDEQQPEGPLHRTVLVYIAGENRLSGNIESDLAQMRKGSVGIGNNALVVYVDAASTKQKPYIMRIKEGEETDVVTFEEDDLSSDPQTMSRVLTYTAEHFPAEDYGLVLWGHASGWILEDSVANETTMAQGIRKAYGVDNGTNNGNSDAGKWMNMPTLAKVLGDWGHPLKFIFADCCQFQCIESAYELRNATEYVIGSPAEIPGEGAPYHTMTKWMFDTSEEFYRHIIDAYFAQVSYGYRVPLSVIQTSEMEQFAAETGYALKAFAPTAEALPDLRYSELIFYKGSVRNLSNSVMYDMNDYMLKYAPTEVYETWKETFDRVVVYKTFTSNWMTSSQIDFSLFTMTEERYGGVSMFIPQQRSGIYEQYNKNIRKMAWYWAAGLNEIGW